MKVFSRVFGKPTATGSSLAERLAAYPAFELPHKGPFASLTEEQARENLAHTLEQRETRIRELRQLLKEDGVEIGNDLQALDIAPLITALHAWAGEHWPALQASQQELTRDAWLSGNRDGPCIAFSMIADMALLLGRLIHARRQSLDWTVDLDPENRSDGMSSVGRVVLGGIWLPQPEVMAIVDIEGVIVNRLLRYGDSVERFENRWLQVTQDALAGKYEGVGVVTA